MPRIVNRRPNAGDNINGFPFKYDADLGAMVSVDDVPQEAADNFLLLDNISILGEKIDPKKKAEPGAPQPTTQTDGVQSLGSTEGAPTGAPTQPAATTESAPAADKQKHARPKAAQVAKPQA